MTSRERLADLYEEHILPHAVAREYRGALERPTRSAVLRNPRCGDEVRLDLAIDAGRVCCARFEARGCLVSQAAASILCEYVEGRTLDDLDALTAAEMLTLLRVPLIAPRQQCGLLAFDALKSIMASRELRSGRDVRTKD